MNGGIKMGFSDVEVSFEAAEHQAECAGCGTYGEAKEFAQCENCRDYFCPECHEEMTTWNSMKVCHQCKNQLTDDRGPDWEEYVAKVEAMFDNREDR